MATARPVVEKLLKALDEFDADSAELVEANRDLLRSLMGDSFATFERHVQGYSLQDAHAALLEAARAQGL
jgi:hypothetical protein